MWVAVGVMAVTTAYSANASAKAANRAAGAAQDNANRRYALESGVAKNQMEEQQVIARDKMTDVTRAFIQAKGKATAIQAETGVTGASSQRIAASQRTKFSEAKGKVAQEVNTNIVNIAQGMLGKKVDTDAMIAEAQSQKKNVFTATAMGAIQGAAKGYSMAGGAKSATGKGVGTKDLSGGAGNDYEAAGEVGDSGGMGWGF